MNPVATTYNKYFNNEQLVKLGVRLLDKSFIELTSSVRFIEDDRISLELLGSDTLDENRIDHKKEVYLSTWSGSSLCRCTALLQLPLYGRRFSLKLTGEVVQKESREFFRLDVSIPIKYSVADKRDRTKLQEEWMAQREELKELKAPVIITSGDGYKLVTWNSLGQIDPLRVNLSGGGIRFKTSEYVDPSTLIPITLFLPLKPPEVIYTMAETLRCQEIQLGRGKGKSYMTAMKFYFINEKDREKIIAFIFAEQRRIMNTRLDRLF